MPTCVFRSMAAAWCRGPDRRLVPCLRVALIVLLNVPLVALPLALDLHGVVCDALTLFYVAGVVLGYYVLLLLSSPTSATSDTSRASRLTCRSTCPSRRAGTRSGMATCSRSSPPSGKTSLPEAGPPARGPTQAVRTAPLSAPVARTASVSAPVAPTATISAPAGPASAGPATVRPFRCTTPCGTARDAPPRNAAPQRGLPGPGELALRRPE